MMIDIAWLAAAFLSVGIHLGSWWEAWRDWRRSVLLPTGDPRRVVATAQHHHAVFRLGVAMATAVIPAVRLIVEPTHITTLCGIGVFALTVAYAVSSVAELWTRAAAVDAVIDSETRAASLPPVSTSKVP